MVPADGPHGVAVGLFVPVNAAGTGDLGELIAAHDGPRVGLAVPLGEHATRHGGIGQGFACVVAVVRVNDAAEAGVKPLAMVAGQVRMAAFLLLLVGPQLCHGEGLHINLIKAFLHGRRINLARRVGQMTGVARGPAEHLRVGNHADFALRIHHVRSDEKLLRLAVDHAVRGRPADALGADDLLQRGRDFVELVRRAARHVRRVSDDPQPPRPRDHRTGAALALVVEHGEVRIDAGDAAGCGDGNLTPQGASQSQQ